MLVGLRRQLRAPFVPTAGAVLLFWASLTPSLLPRSPVYQGVVSAVATLLGYGFGALLGWVVRTAAEAGWWAERVVEPGSPSASSPSPGPW